MLLKCLDIITLYIVSELHGAEEALKSEQTVM